MEDSYLWARMIVNGAQCANIDEPLVNVRIGRDMFERRGGWEYFKKYRTGRKMVRATGFISYWDYLSTVAVQFVVSLSPNALRGWVYKRFLHR
jgi:hypothetical protein